MKFLLSKCKNIIKKNVCKDQINFKFSYYRKKKNVQCKNKIKLDLIGIQTQRKKKTPSFNWVNKKKVTSVIKECLIFVIHETRDNSCSSSH